MPQARASYPVQRARNTTDFGLLVQEHKFAALDNCYVVQKSLTGGNVFQMDQTPSSYQEVYGHQR